MEINIEIDKDLTQIKKPIIKFIEKEEEKSKKQKEFTDSAFKNSPVLTFLSSFFLILFFISGITYFVLVVSLPEILGKEEIIEEDSTTYLILVFLTIFSQFIAFFIFLLIQYKEERRRKKDKSKRK